MVIGEKSRLNEKKKIKKNHTLENLWGYPLGDWERDHYLRLLSHSESRLVLVRKVIK